jgi:hypothetical protein
MPTAAAATADAAPRPVSPESGRANGVAVVAELTWEGRVSPAEDDTIVWRPPLSGIGELAIGVLPPCRRR